MDDWEESGLSEYDYNNQKDFVDALPSVVTRSLLEYSGDTYTAINDYLEGDKLDKRGSYSNRKLEYIKYVIQNIDLAFSLAPPLKNDIVVYRGLKLPIYTDSRRNTLMLSNYSGKYEGFTSTSYDMNVALKFGSSGVHKTVLKITVPAGSKVIYLGFPNINPDENEILLNRNNIISINSIEKLDEYGNSQKSVVESSDEYILPSPTKKSDENYIIQLNAKLN
jgi:hypothetical protein